MNATRPRAKHAPIARRLAALVFAAAAILLASLAATPAAWAAPGSTPETPIAPAAYALIEDDQGADDAPFVPLAPGSALQTQAHVDYAPLKIALDAGHGGYDGGAEGNGLLEKDCNLKIARFLKGYLEQYADVEVLLTRSDDTYVGLVERVERAQAWGAQAFVSLHVNSLDTPGHSGALAIVPNDSSYQAANRDKSRALGDAILKQIARQTGLPNNGFLIRDSTDGSTYSDGHVQDYYSVIRNSRKAGMVGTLIEHGFINGASLDVQLLSSDDGLRKLARADADGIAGYFGLSHVKRPQLHVTEVVGTQITLGWNLVEGATSYRVGCLADDGAEVLQTLNGNAESCTFASLVPGARYRFYVEACANGEWSNHADADMVTVAMLPAPQASAQTTDYQELTFTWPAVAGATRYSVAERLPDGTTKTWTESAGAGGYVLRGLEEGSTHWFVVRAGAGGNWTHLDVTPELKATVDVVDHTAETGYRDVRPDSYYAQGVVDCTAAGLFQGYADGTFGTWAPMTRAQLVTVLYRACAPDPWQGDANLTGLPDVAVGAYYTPAANWAVSSGVITGTVDQGGARVFSPTGTVTMQQLVTMLSRLHAWRTAQDDAAAETGDDPAPGDGEAGEGAGDATAAEPAGDGGPASDGDGGDPAAGDGSASPAEPEPIDLAVLDAYADSAKVAPYAREHMAWAVTKGLVGQNTPALNPAGDLTRSRAATILARALAADLL